MDRSLIQKLHPHRGLPLIALIALVLGALLPPATPAAAQAGAPAVRYDATAGIIYVGANYDKANPAQAPYAGYPSHPDAPKAAISIPAVAAALKDAGHEGLLVNQGERRWLLKSDLVISPTARLDVTSASIAALRLDSTPDRFPALTRLVATGGHLLIQGVSVSSWDTQANGVDLEYRDGRGYLLAQTGGRMDIIDADVSYLGWADGEPSGLSWRKRATPADPKTGATGSIIRSDIHHNYFGQYSYEAYGLKVFNNKFRDSVFYGFDPHDFSFNFEVAYNKVYNNGKHGIIFSRGCEWNWIHHNEVYNNAEHGIMLDRGTNNNKISDNLVYNNRDGVAIFQSSNNIVQNNVLRDNERGVRINATYDIDDEYDGISVANTVIGNTISNNTQYGVYLYERADKNTIVKNTIEGSAGSGIYLKTGGNSIAENIIRGNGHGITIIGGPNTPFPPGKVTPVPPEGTPGHKNTIYQNTIEDSAGIGIQVKGGVDTLIGPRDPAADPEKGNIIRGNGTYGISLADASVDNAVRGNTIHGNDADGVLIKGLESVGNLLSRNSIAANSGRGIAVSDGANAGVLPPTITSPLDAKTVTGTAPARAVVEIYRDQRGQGRVYKGSVTAGSDGRWSFALPAGDDPKAEGHISALVTTSAGNSSAFVTNGPVIVEATYEIGAGRNGHLTIFVNGPGAVVTLPQMEAKLRTISPTVELLDNQGGGVWQANASLFINRGVTLQITKASGVSWLKLRSQGGDISLSAGGEGNYNYQSFTHIRTNNGNLLIDGVKITSWDPEKQDYDRDVKNGRSYLLAKYESRMDIRNSEISYLGSADGESYGISWRDTNDTDAPDVLRTRVTGEVIDSVFSFNYYGIYTYQAANMVFRGNKFHSNIGYGFDPHDYSNNFLVENNEAFNNGNHGFIISRGCNNFIFRNNKSYNNRYTVSADDRNAHGFMLDPGSPNSKYSQVPSFENILENNQAWGNDGYGLRVLGSISNTIRLNTFSDNLQGITLERGSYANLVEGNTIKGSGLYGVYLTGGSDGNTIKGNTISGSGRHGVYIKTGGNSIAGNTISANGSVGAKGPEGAGIATLPDTPATALADLTLPGAELSLAAADPELLSDPALASALEGNRLTDNRISGNIDDGIALKGAAGTLVSGNTITGNRGHGVYLSAYEGLGATGTTVLKNVLTDNGGHGLRANGLESSGNSWSQNSVARNVAGGIRLTSGANADMAAPAITKVTAKAIEGTAAPGATVEIFSDAGGQGLYYEGRALAGADGKFRLGTGKGWRAPNLNAVATMGGGSSGFTIDRGFVRLYLPLLRR